MNQIQTHPRCGSGMSKASGFPRKTARLSENGFKDFAFVLSQ